ncbi:hypothetical protein GCM10023091_36320 [Ravibacter arvi]|uniref:GtrA-like protein domain-containing protein n=1 Tax=Ravibacter arvi TaxID=2051041 RepID=A0ABP8MA14_9BACT
MLDIFLCNIVQYYSFATFNTLLLGATVKVAITIYYGFWTFMHANIGWTSKVSIRQSDQFA